MTKPAFLLGDSIAGELEGPLRQQPSVLAKGLYAAVEPAASIHAWAQDFITDAIDERLSAEDVNKQPIPPPDLAIVSLGLGEIAAEPAETDASTWSDMRADMDRIIEALRKAGMEVVWVLPPALPGERQARGVITDELAKRNVRLFDASGRGRKSFAPRRPYQALPNGHLKDYTPLAQDLVSWIPIHAPSPVPRPTIKIEPRPEHVPLTFVEHAPSRLASFAATTGGKVALGAATLAVVGGAAFWLRRRRA